MYIRQIQVSLSCFRRAGSKMEFFFWFLCGSCLLWVFLLCCVPCFPSLSLSFSLSPLSFALSLFFFFSLSFFHFPVSSSSLLCFFFLLFFFLASFFLLLFVFRLVSLSVSLAGFVCWLVLCLCWLKLLAACHLFVTSFFLFFAAPVSNVVAAL